MDFAIVKCCSADAFDAVPQSLVKFSVGGALAALVSAGWKAVADAGAMCVVEKDGIEATLYSSGRVLVKTPDGAAAKRVAAELYRDAKI